LKGKTIKGKTMRIIYGDLFVIPRSKPFNGLISIIIKWYSKQYSNKAFNSFAPNGFAFNSLEDSFKVSP
jgi:hypothetical protein